MSPLGGRPRSVLRPPLLESSIIRANGMKGHPLTAGLYILSWLLILNFAEDVLFGAYPNVLAVRALKQST